MDRGESAVVCAIRVHSVGVLGLSQEMLSTASRLLLFLFAPFSVHRWARKFSDSLRSTFSDRFLPADFDN